MAEGTVEVADRFDRYYEGIKEGLSGYSLGHDKDKPEDREMQLANDVSQLSLLAYMAGKSGREVSDDQMAELTEIIDQKFGGNLTEERKRMMKANERLSRYVKEEEDE